MQRSLYLLSVASLCLVLTSGTIYSQSSIQLSRSIVSAGAVSSSGGGLILKGTLGQQTAGLSTESDVMLGAGFWYTPLMLTTSVPDRESAVPAMYAVEAYPNPFATSVHIRYVLTAPAELDVRVFNLAGKVVAEFHRARLVPGTYSFEWPGTTLSNNTAPVGMYIVTVNARTTVGETITSSANLVKISK